MTPDNATTVAKSDSLAPERLDVMTYRLIAMGFVLLTLVIITGAAWAQYTWHRWWSWDPKETSALVAWLEYLIYLHGRLLAWPKKATAWVAVLGALAVVFCWAGVNFLGGLHAYGKPEEGIRTAAAHSFSGMNGTEALLSKGFLVSYLAAWVVYLAAASFRSRRAALVGTVVMGLGAVLQTSAIILRSVSAGRLPFGTGYEYALSFAWAMSIVYLIVHRRINTPVFGAAALPLLLGILAYGFLLFPEKGVSPLPVALQNLFWLHLHVAIAIVSYAILIVATATAALYLVRARGAEPRGASGAEEAAE
jgi:ABC-type transport system involved in cytochrome c biogenesis permease subunit